MAKKKKIKGKIAFGIFQEGLSVKIAQLFLSDGKIDIQRLEARELSYPLYVKEVTEDKENLEEAEDIDLLGDIDGDDLELPELSDLDTSDELDDLEKDEVLTGKDDLQQMLLNFPLESGKIALNANEEQIEYYQFNETFGTKGLAKKLINEIIPKEEKKSKNYSIQHIINPDKSILAFVHRGEFELLNAIQEINPVLSKKNYLYDLISTNEIALMYLLRQSYELSPEDYTLIIYMGHEKSGIILKGYNFVKRFPIMVIDTMMDSVLESIYSKTILELDISDIPNPTRILMAGGYIDEGDIEFFRDKFDSDTIIERLELEKIYQKSEDRLDITPEKIAEFAIPISLAWKTLDKKKKYFPCNLLPKKIIEEQKHFKLAWHGFIVFVAIFFFAFTATTRNMRLKREYVKLNNLALAKDIELKEKEGIVKIIKDVKIELNAIQIELDKVKGLIGTKNQWFYILQTLSNSFKKNKISWITDLSNSQDKFVISAYTTKRKNIVKFSKLFPNGKLGNVYKTEIQGIQAWEFEIEYSYPNPDDVAFYNSSIIVKSASPEKIEKEEKQVEEIKPIIVKKVKPEQVEPVVVKELKPEQTKEFETVEIEEVVQEQVEEKVVEIKVYQTALSNKEIKDLYQQITKNYFSGDFETANLKYKDFVDRFPKHYLAYSANYLRGECLFLLGELSQAKAIFEKTVKLGGTRVPSALLMLGNLYQKEENFQQAKSCWDQLLKEYPSNPMAEIAAEKIKTLNKNASSELNSINQIYFSGNLDEAVKRYDEFIAQYADHKLVENAAYLKGECLYLLGETSQAKAIFEKTIKAGGSKTPSALLMLGNSYKKEENIKKAKTCWNQLLKQYPTNPMAEIAAKKIKALNIDIDSELNNINRIYFSGNFREAEKKYKEFIAQNPDSKHVYTAQYLQGECLYLMGKLSEAIEIFKSTLRYEGTKTPDALIMLGNSYHKEKDLDKAISYWAQLIRRYPYSNLSNIARKKINSVEKKENVPQT